MKRLISIRINLCNNCENISLYLFARIFGFPLPRILDKGETSCTKRKSKAFSETEADAEIRQGSFLANGSAPFARARSLLQACRFHSPVRFISKQSTNAVCQASFDHCGNATSTHWSNKTVSDTKEKHCCLVGSEIHALWYSEGFGWEGKEVTKYRRYHATFPLTLRSSTSLFSARFLPSSRRREYRIKDISLLLSSLLFAVFVFPPVVSSSRLITTCQILFPNGENERSCWTRKGESRGRHIDRRERTSEAVIHTVVCRQPRL